MDKMAYFERLHVQRGTMAQAMEKGPLFLPTVCDCFTAMIAEDSGYPAMVLGGEDFSGYYAGIPDIGLITPTELRLMASQVSKVTNIPLIIDMNNGFGNEMNAIRAAIDLVESGAGGLILNDQVFPNRYGSEAKNRFLFATEFANKVRAVADALQGSGCALIVRTDCARELGLEEAIGRMNEALDAGATMVFARGVSGRQDAERVAREVRGTKMFELSRDLGDRALSFDDLVNLGYAGVLCPTFVDGAYSAYEQQLKQAYVCKNDFFVNPVDLINGVERREFLGLNKWLELGKQYNAEIRVASKTKALD